jgi:capsular exopolysaccharide synthesis family protein
VLLELRDTSVRTDEQLELVHAGPLLGRIPFDRRIRDAPLVIQDDTHSIRAEAFRQLRTNLQFIDVERPIQVLVVTSSVASEGKSALSANLALAMVAANRRVLVIEADFRRPRLADYFGLERAVGLTDVLAGRVDVEDVLQPWGTDGLVILPSGQLPPNPSELLGSEAMARLLERFRSDFDMIIIDTPPLLPVTDAAVLASSVDGVVLVSRCSKTTTSQVKQAAGSLTAVGARLLGCVLNMKPTRGADAYTYYDYSRPEPRSRRLPAFPAKSATTARRPERVSAR